MEEALDRSLGKKWDSGVNASPQQMGEWDSWQGWTEKIALTLGTVAGLKKCELFRSFDAFRNDALLEFFVEHRKAQLDAAKEIAVHPVARIGELATCNNIVMFDC